MRTRNLYTHSWWWKVI